MLNARLIVFLALVAVACCKTYGFAELLNEIAPKVACDPGQTQVKCEEVGYFCSDCAHMYSCGYDSNDILVGICMEKCTGDKPFCTTKGVCVATGTDDCSLEVEGYNLKCTEPGIFPHPHNCKEYFICYLKSNVPGGPDERERKGTNKVDAEYEGKKHACPTGWLFDLKSMRCSKKEDVNKKCPMPVQLCTGLRTGPIPGNPRLTYACKSDTPGKYVVSMSYCKDNFLYIAGRCFDASKEMSIDTNKKCNAKGTFYVPNCKQYNECTAISAIPILRTCPVGQQFNKTLNPIPICHDIPC